MKRLPPKRPISPSPTRRHRRLTQGVHGSAVITVLVLAAVTAVIASSFLFRSAQEAKLATRSFFQSAALNLAEAGIEEGFYAANTQEFRNGNGWSLVTGSATDYQKVISSGLNFQQATGAIYIRLDNALSNTPTVTAAGVVNIPNQPRLVKQLRVRSLGPARIWTNAIVAKGNVILSANAEVDSYDSLLGPWNRATNRSDHATVASNASVQVTNSGGIYGYVATGGMSPQVGNNGRIYGALSLDSLLVDTTRVRTDFNANLLDATSPTGTAYSLGSTFQVGTLPRLGDVPGPNGRFLYACTNMDISGANTVTIAGPVDLIVTGNAIISGVGKLVVSGSSLLNSSFNLYCPGTIDLGGLGVINNTARAIKASIWGTKPSGGVDQDVTIGGISPFYGTLYAPNAGVSLSGNASVNGAIVGKTVTMLGTTSVHYDIQLWNANSPGGPTPQAGAGDGYYRVSSWSELTTAPNSGHAFARDSRPPFATLF